MSSLNFIFSKFPLGKELTTEGLRKVLSWERTHLACSYGLPKGPSGNKVYILLPAPRPAGKARATSIPGAVCKERATPPAGLRAAARRGAAPKGAYRRCCRSSTMHTGIACVAAPRICPPGARAKMHTLFPDGPLVHDFI